MQQAAAQAAAAEEAAAASDAQYAAGQEELELLMKERAETEAAAGKASAAVEAANKQLADALQLKQAAEAALEVRVFGIDACRLRLPTFRARHASMSCAFESQSHEVQNTTWTLVLQSACQIDFMHRMLS